MATVSRRTVGTAATVAATSIAKRQTLVRDARLAASAGTASRQTMVGDAQAVASAARRKPTALAALFTRRHA